jgi:DUF917 family protein
MREITLQEAQDIVLGCAVMGCGGGGGLEGGLSAMTQVYAEGRRVRLCAVDDLPPDALIASPYLCGSVASEAASGAGFARASWAGLIEAMQVLERQVSKPFAALFATELGAANTGYAMAAAAMCGLPIIDADGVGRAAPELIHSTMYLKGISMCPLSIVTAKGDRLVILSVSDDSTSETVARALAISAGGAAFVCDHPVSAMVARDGLILGSLSLSERIGQAVRAARQTGADPAVAAAAAGGGALLYRGRVTEPPCWRDEGGFTYGEVSMRGLGDWEGKDARLGVKNENMTLQIDGRLIATVPDLITLLRIPDGAPLLNPSVPLGVEAAVVCFPAPALWRTQKGLRIFGPEYLGLNCAYTPVERWFGL